MTGTNPSIVSAVIQVPAGVRRPTVALMRPEILPFTADHVGDAARLLAARHTRHRQLQPLLSPRFEDPAACEAEVAAAWKAPEASGAVAVRDGRVVAFLLGAPKDSTVWGPNIWVESAGMAVGPAEDAELMRDVYAGAATRWVEEGRTAQYVLVPAADDRLVRAWFQLGFGHQQSHAVRENLPEPPRPRPGVTIRPAERGDIPVLTRLELELPAHQGLSPCFSSGPTSTLEEAVAEWEEDFDDEDFTTWVAVHDGTVVGSAVGCALTKSSSNNGLIRPDDAGFLGFAAVLPEARGLGAGRALGETVMHWSGRAGYACVTTDWRQTNLLSSRTWTALGFEPTFLRLHRVLGY
jgi:GNAT superfamily N-acetyltransferase